MDLEARAAAGAELRSRAGKVRVICLGLSALDQIWRVPALFSGGSQKIRSAEYETMGGGMRREHDCADEARSRRSSRPWKRAFSTTAG